MSRYIGMDVHAESTTAVVLGPSGRRIEAVRLATDAPVLKEFVMGVRRPRYLCFEEGNLAEWLYEELEPLVDECLVVQPDKHQGCKNDLLDAQSLAERMRRDATGQPVFKAPTAIRGLREAVRSHCVLQRDKVRTKQRISALCGSRGLRNRASELYRPDSTRLEVLIELPEQFRQRMALYCDELDGLTDLVHQAEHWLREEAERVPIVRRLATAPGIGVIRGAYIAAVVITPHRFRTCRQFWSYCGLGVVTRSSSDWAPTADGWRRKRVQHTRGLNRNRHALLKNVFKGAAISIAGMPDHVLGAAYRRLLETTKPSLARLTIARRLAAAVLAMWKTGQDYDPSKHTSRNM